MSAAKHTPGPWPVSEPNGRGMGWRAGPAWLGNNSWSEQTAADARLVGAAPKLLEALRACARLVLMSDGANAPAYQQAMAVIREAESKA